MAPIRSLISLAFILSIAGGAIAADSVKTESFDRDPGWEGFNNHIVPERVPTVAQNFGYSATTNLAGKTKGEIGGTVVRASKPAYFGERIAPKTLNDKLSASGTFAMTKSTSGGGMFFGWFNSHQQGANGRPVGSIGLELGTERTGGRLAIRLITATNTACGKYVTPSVRGEHRPTPIKNDGTRYTWKFDYDPAGNNGDGRFEFTVTSNSPTPADFEGKPVTVDLPAGFKSEGTTFDHFGLMNSTKPGGQVAIYFDDVQLDGKSFDFSNDPGWIESGSRETYQDTRVVGAHDFGFSANTNFAGGAKPGEFGGDVWRGGKRAYCADKVGPLSFENRLEASGKVILLVGAPDSDVTLGWFNGKESGNFIGVHIGGPTRVGHYFSPMFKTVAEGKGKTETAPVLAPGKVFDWTLVYDPSANDGIGEMRVTLGDQSAMLPLKKGHKAQGGTFDHFGLWNTPSGGQLVRIFLDDVKYTAQ